MNTVEFDVHLGLLQNGKVKPKNRMFLSIFVVDGGVAVFLVVKISCS